MSMLLRISGNSTMHFIKLRKLHLIKRTVEFFMRGERGLEFDRLNQNMGGEKLTYMSQ